MKKKKNYSWTYTKDIQAPEEAFSPIENYSNIIIYFFFRGQLWSAWIRIR